MNVNTLTGHRIALSRVFGFILLATLFTSPSAWHDVVPVVHHALSLISWALMSIGVMGRIWCASYISGFKNERLMTEGPYSICRHPLYFFSFIGGLGVMLMTRTFAIPFLFSVLFWSYYPAVMAREEKVLREKYGITYEKYCVRVPRYWPDWNLLSEPATYSISTRHFRGFLMDVIWFLLSAGIIQFIYEMHSAHYLPAVLRIY